jgi:hypothetical protein
MLINDFPFHFTCRYELFTFQIGMQQTFFALTLHLGKSPAGRKLEENRKRRNDSEVINNSPASLLLTEQLCTPLNPIKKFASIMWDKQSIKYSNPFSTN